MRTAGTSCQPVSPSFFFFSVVKGIPRATMWIRPSLTRNPRLRGRCSLPWHSRCSPQPSTAADAPSTFFLTRELVDDLHVDIGSSTQRSLHPAAQNDDAATAAALWLPFHGLSLTYAMHPALRSVVVGHALLFDSLAETPDLLQLLASHNPCSGGLAAARLRCLTATFEMVQPLHHDIQRLLTLPVHQRHLVDEIRLVQRIASPSPNAPVLLARELEHMGGGGGFSTDVLWTLLAIPCSVEMLRVVLDAARRACPAGLTAHEFQKAAHALLKNDNFFCERSFNGMHRLLMDVVLPAIGDSSGAFDVLAVRWTPLMNKWSRVYAKSTKGFLLYDCFCALRRVAPAAETKMPPSFYVRLLGALLDASVLGSTEDGLAGWEKMTTVAADALRLFGRNAADLRAVWILLLKAALTLPPRRADYQRLLQAYHLCAQCGHPAPLDRQGFLQVTRLVSEAICATSTHADAVEGVIHDFCSFLHEQDHASFLWMLDGVGTMLTDLWDTHGAAVVSAAQELLTTLEQLLRDRRVAGVDIHANPVIARALEHFQLGGPILFWWTCGCGAELPCTSKRCTSCLRSTGASWKCAACAAMQKAPCGVQACACGQPNPRLAAATRTGHAVCERCGEIKDAEGICVRCAEQQSAQSRHVECAQCHETYAFNALHCPRCFAANPNKPPLYLWHCASCDDFNYSIWSTCRTCKTPRKAGAFFLPFVPWKCGCGALSHPGRLVCSSCGTGARHHTFTCAGCYAHVPMRSLRRVVITVDGKTIPVHLCPHCQTPHPRSDLLLYSPLLTRHCMFCAKPVHHTSVAPHGAFHHCGVVQGVNENYVFRCTHCAGEQEGPKLQTGYHCRHCLFPRPEVEALMGATAGEVWSPPSAVEAASPVTAVWRCLHETEEGELCGQWNYGWSAHCVACGTGRPDSTFECRARAQLWRCATCGNVNRPIDVLFCPHCKSGLQPVQPCVTCGMPHLSYVCRVHMQGLK